MKTQQQIKNELGLNDNAKLVVFEDNAGGIWCFTDNASGQMYCIENDEALFDYYNNAEFGVDVIVDSDGVYDCGGCAGREFIGLEIN